MYSKYFEKIKNLLQNFNKFDQFKYLNWFLSVLKIEIFWIYRKIYKKRDIVRLNFWYNIWSEINKERFAVVISPNFLNIHSHNLIVLPIKTYKWKYNRNMEIKILKESYPFLKNDSLILLNQIKTVSKKRILNDFWVLSVYDYNKISLKLFKFFKKINNP